MTSSTGAFQGKLWKICVVDLQQGLAWLCWAGELSPRQSAGRAGAARARLGLAGSRAGRANGPLAWLGQNGQAGAWLWAGKAGWGRLRLGYGQAGARLWAGKAGWGRLGLGYGHARLWAGKAGWGRLWLGYGQARLWAGKAGKAGWGRLWLSPNGQAGAGWGLAIGRQAGAGWGRLWLGQMGRLGQAGAWLWAGKAGWGRLRLGYGQAVARSNGQAGARLWAGKAGWGRLGLGPNGQGPLAWLGQNGQAGAGLWAGKAGWGRLGLGYGQARLWAGKAGWGRLRLGYGQAVAWSKWAGWGRLGLGYGEAVARSKWAGWGKLGAESWEVFRKEILKHVVDQNSTGVDRVMLISKGTHQGREQAMGWLTADAEGDCQEGIGSKGQSDRRAGHTHTQAEGNRATESIKTEGRPTEDYTRRKIEIPTGGAFRGGFAGRAGQLSSALLGWVLGRARLGLAGSRAGRANDLALKNKYKERRGRLGWVLDRLGSWGLVQLGWAGADKRQVGADWAVQGQVGLGSAWLGWVLDNLGSRIEENPPKGKTPPGKETSVKDGFKGKTPLAGKGNTVNFE
ncbi:hypothetical protein PPACK8108_LOCUS2976 [Phakopsora pachyrhizi]|uniref:Uncharacterized protein n=1 Tax=Phakopsora pachyrhizi TaxID=170000 RepID=A0AAV0AK98_PHAPC|nr:hypothetical protein PPACK8108_LOCUS2976 [Phakopsora pachyrhizi]